MSCIFTPIYLQSEQECILRQLRYSSEPFESIVDALLVPRAYNQLPKGEDLSDGSPCSRYAGNCAPLATLAAASLMHAPFTCSAFYETDTFQAFGKLDDHITSEEIEALNNSFAFVNDSREAGKNVPGAAIANGVFFAGSETKVTHLNAARPSSSTALRVVPNLPQFIAKPRPFASEYKIPSCRRFEPIIPASVLANVEELIPPPFVAPRAPSRPPLTDNLFQAPRNDGVEKITDPLASPTDCAMVQPLAFPVPMQVPATTPAISASLAIASPSSAPTTSISDAESESVYDSDSGRPFPGANALFQALQSMGRLPDLEELEAYGLMDMPFNDVCDLLAVGGTTLKQHVRILGIDRWPYRHRQSMRALRERLQNCTRFDPAKKEYYLNLIDEAMHVRMISFVWQICGIG